MASDGTSGLNFEHSWGDGVAILRYFQDVLKDSNTNPFVEEPNTPSTVVPADLVREISESIFFLFLFFFVEGWILPESLKRLNFSILSSI